MLQTGWTPLHHAACCGHCGMVDSLITAGATVDITDNVCCSNNIV